MLRICIFFLLVFCFSSAILPAQTTDEINAVANRKVFEIGFSGVTYRGYDFSKDIMGVRDKYNLAGTPGIVFIFGSRETQLRISTQYSESSFNSELRNGVLGRIFNGFINSRAHYYRQAAEIRIGFLRSFTTNKKTRVQACYSGDVFYGYGRHKYAIFYNDIGGFGEELGYRFNTAGFTQNFGLKFLLKANFVLYAETGFAFEGVFAKRNYNDASLAYFNTNTTIGANMRLLQISLTKKI